MGDVAYTLAPTEILRDFDQTAERMRGDLRASGWRESTRISPERWSSPDRRRTLPLAAAWELARRDAAREAATAPAPRPAPVVDRSPDYDQTTTTPDDVHGAIVRTGCAGRQSP